MTTILTFNHGSEREIKSRHLASKSPLSQYSFGHSWPPTDLLTSTFNFRRVSLLSSFWASVGCLLVPWCQLLIAYGLLPDSKSQRITHTGRGWFSPPALTNPFSHQWILLPFNYSAAHDSLPTGSLVMAKVLRKGQTHWFGWCVRDTEELLFSL